MPGELRARGAGATAVALVLALGLAGSAFADEPAGDAAEPVGPEGPRSVVAETGGAASSWPSVSEPSTEEPVMAETPGAAPSEGDEASTDATNAGAAPRPAQPEAAATVTSERPAAETTGVTPGRSLTPMAGGVVTASRTTIADRVIEGDVTFTGSSLTLRNLRVTGHVIVRGDGVVVEDSEVGSLALSGARNVRVSRVEVFGRSGQDGVHITSDTRRVSDVVIEDTLIHDPVVTPTSHYDGIQVRGVDRLTIRRTVVELGAFKPQHNASLFLENANGGNAGVVVESSWLLGGGYVLYSFGTDVSVRDTVLGGGRWGNLYPASWLSEIVEFVDNTDQGGRPLGLSTASGASIRLIDPVDRARKTAFVSALYEDFLGRGPTAAEALHWVSRLDAGVARHEVATALSRTDQWISAVITRFYRDTLGREPDSRGLSNWVLLAKQGRPMAQIAAGFYASDEYLGRVAGGDLRIWVEDLYGKLLFRRADSVGLRNWLRALSTGTSRTQVAYGFYQADETSRVRVATLYRALLGREPDANGLRTWPPVVRAQGDLALAAALAASDEYYERAQRR